MTNSAINWSWVAGLFEGEGSMTMAPYRDRRKGLFTRCLVVAMCDEDVVRKLHRMLDVGRVRYVPPRRAKWSESWRWECSRWPDIEMVLTGMLPYLGERRTARAKEMLDNPAGPHGSPPLSHCKKGHALSGDNLYVSPKGKRRCRACARERYAKYQREGRYR